MGAVRLLNLDRKTQDFHQAQRYEVNNLYGHVYSERMVDDSGLRPACELDDFVSTRPNLAPDTLREWIFSEYGRQWSQFLNGLKGKRLTYSLRVLVGLYGTLVLLLPTGLMYLIDLSQSASSGLLVAFSIVFCFAIGVLDFPFMFFFFFPLGYVSLLLFFHPGVCSS